METINFSEHWAIVSHEYPEFSQAEYLSNDLITVMVYQNLGTKKWMLTVRDRHRDEEEIAYIFDCGRDEVKAFAEGLLRQSVKNSQIAN